MKMLTVLLALAIVQPLSTGDLDRVRSEYLLAPEDSKSCVMMIAWLETRKEYPLYLAYLGGFRAINARHLSGPLRKLQSFRKGTEEIDRAVLLRPKDVEIRFVRHSIQLGAPGILGYRDNIDEDRMILKDQIGTAASSVRKMIEDILDK